ncbi:MAG: hypothetical protein F6K47_27875, partial [Symploca sp. SIO2E6]|nr:hypothetical protein [Symploca sp. SIO2E6]
MANAEEASIHRNQQRENWQNFLQKLKDLKDQIGCTNDDLAIGLGVSRQKFYQFMKDPDSRLPIDRAHVLELWDYLSEGKGQQFCQQEPHTLDELLEAAGFRSTLGKNYSFERIRYRLEGSWIQSSAVLSRLVDDMIDLILDRGGNSFLDNKDDEEDYYTIAQAKNWPEEHLKAQANRRTTNRYIQQIDRFVYFGKVKFCLDELYELYQGILENQRFRAFDLDLEAIDCQFHTLSFSLPEEAQTEASIVNIAQLCGQAEQELHVHSPESLPNQQLLPTFPPVINASIIFNLRDSYQEDTTGKELQRVTFSYACACTHLESILVALSNGLGYFLSESVVTNGSRT